MKGRGTTSTGHSNFQEKGHDNVMTFNGQENRMQEMAVQGKRKTGSEIKEPKFIPKKFSKKTVNVPQEQAKRASVRFMILYGIRGIVECFCEIWRILE